MSRILQLMWHAWGVGPLSQGLPLRSPSRRLDAGLLLATLLAGLPHDSRVIAVETGQVVASHVEVAEGAGWSFYEYEGEADGTDS